MRLLLIFLLCALVYVQSQDKTAANKQDAQDQVKKSSANQPVPGTRQGGSEAATKQVQPVERNIATEAHHEQNGAQRVKEVNDSLLVVFTSVLAIFAWLQWKMLGKHEEWMRKHDANLAQIAVHSEANAKSAADNAKAADKNAEAALLNARAVINSERPWVIVVLEAKLGVLTFKASNDGRSPAVILDCFAQHSIETHPLHLLHTPHYGIAIRNPIPLLTPNFGHDQLGPFIDLYRYPFSEFMTENPDILKKITAGRSHLVFWFKILYTTQTAIDAKIPPYETRCCFEYSPDMTVETKTVGSADYNKYT